MEFENICRSCLQQQNAMQSVFEFSGELNETIQFSEIIKNLANIEVTLNDGFPNKICVTCIDELNRAYKFINQLKCSEKTLRSATTAETEVDTKPDVSLTKEIETLNKVNKTEIECKDEKYNNVFIKTNIEDVFKEEIQITDTESNEELDDNSEDIDNDLLESHEDVDDEVIVAPENIPTKSFPCKNCDKVFESNKKLITHRKQNHSGNDYICGECGDTFADNKHLKIHLKCHLSDAEKPFACSECDAKYLYEFQLTQHSYKHKNEKPFPCDECGKGCLTAESLKRHLKVHDKNYIENKPKHVCSDCGKTYKYPSSLLEHMKVHSGEKPFLCSYCGKGYRQKGQLAYHIRGHTGTRPYKCSVCNMTFTAQGILKVHMRRHTDERPFVCDICGRAFRQSSDMQAHKRGHLGIKKVECQVCKKKMSSTGQLTIHMRIHTGEKPYPCPECKKSFATRTMVAKHMRTHTGEKPFICPVCNKGFSQNSSMKTHLKMHSRPPSQSKKIAQLATKKPNVNDKLVQDQVQGETEIIQVGKKYNKVIILPQKKLLMLQEQGCSDFYISASAT